MSVILCRDFANIPKTREKSFRQSLQTRRNVIFVTSLELRGVIIATSASHFHETFMRTFVFSQPFALLLNSNFRDNFNNNFKRFFDVIILQLTIILN